MNRPDQARLAGSLQIARHHRQHERFYGMKGFEEATELRRASTALKVLADRWESAEPAAASDLDFDHPHLQAAGCDDLNDQAGTATSGILFMEGELESSEIGAMRARLTELAAWYANTASWGAAKMDAGWERESALLRPEFATMAWERHKALLHTTMAVTRLGVASRLLTAAHTALTSQSFRVADLRADLDSAQGIVRTAAWLIDAAAAIVAEQAADLGLSDPHWTAYIGDLTEYLKQSRADPVSPPSARDSGG